MQCAIDAGRGSLIMVAGGPDSGKTTLCEHLADPEESRYQLMRELADFQAKVAPTQSLLIILEDLHVADKGTLDTSIYISRHIFGRARKERSCR